MTTSPINTAAEGPRYNFGFPEGSREEAEFIATLHRRRARTTVTVLVLDNVTGKRFAMTAGNAADLYHGRLSVCPGCDGPGGHLFACGDVVERRSRPRKSESKSLGLRRLLVQGVSLSALRKMYIEAALVVSNGNTLAASRMLGVSRNTVIAARSVTRRKQ